MIYPTQLYDRICTLFHILEKLPVFIHEKCFIVGEMHSFEEIKNGTYNKPSYLIAEMHDYPSIKQLCQRSYIENNPTTVHSYQTRCYALHWMDRYPSVENKGLEVTTLLYEQTGETIQPEQVEGALLRMEGFMNEVAHAFTTVYSLEQYDLVDIFRLSTDNGLGNSFGLYPFLEYRISFDAMLEMNSLYQRAFVDMTGREDVFLPSARFFKPPEFWTRRELRQVTKKVNGFLTSRIGIPFSESYAGSYAFRVPGCDAFPYAVITQKIQSGRVEHFTQDCYRLLRATGGADNVQEVFYPETNRRARYFQRIYCLYLVSDYKVKGRRRVFKRTFGNNSLSTTFPFVAVEKMGQALEEMMAEASVLAIEDRLFTAGPEYAYGVLEMYQKLSKAPAYRIDHDWLRKQFCDHFIPVDITVTRLP